MEFDVELEIPDGSADLSSYVGRELEEARFRVTAEMARRIANPVSPKGILNQTTKTLWPQRTGYSRDSFLAEDTPGGAIEVRNTAPYAAAVNNDPYLRNGQPNPNYRTAQKTIEHWWDSIVEWALRKAGVEVAQS